MAKKEENQCECHERDSSFVCKYCWELGYRGHMDPPLTEAEKTELRKAGKEVPGEFFETAEDMPWIDRE